MREWSGGGVLRGAAVSARRWRSVAGRYQGYLVAEPGEGLLVVTKSMRPVRSKKTSAPSRAVMTPDVEQHDAITPSARLVGPLGLA